MSPKAIPPMAGAEEVMAADHAGPGRRLLGRSCPNERGAERAIAAGADELEVVVSASRDAQPQERAAGRSTSRSTAPQALVGMAHDAGLPVDGDRVDRVRLPLRGRRRAGARSPRSRGALLDARRRRRLVRRHDRHGDAAAGRRRCSTSSTGVGVDARRVGLHFHNTRGTGLANVLAGLERGVRAVRRVDRRARRLPVRAGRDRATSSPRTSCTCSTTWRSTPASISTR